MAVLRYNGNNKGYAQELRRNMTAQERHLWYDYLKHLSVPVKRQRQFGDYIVDFYIASAGLVIELDGSQHYKEHAIAYDQKREAYLNAQGLKVIRFTNLEVDNNFEGVCATIDREIGTT